MPLIALALLVVAYLLPGLVGHDPWKQDETYVFDIVHHLVTTGDWVVPVNAGVPFMEKPPLYYLVAAAFARVLSPPLAQFDAARLASGFFTLLTLLVTGLAARELWGEGAGRRAVLLLMACLGLLLYAHEMVTDIALLAGFATAFLGLAMTDRSPWIGGLVLGTGVGMGFMSKGLLAPGTIGLLALLLPLLFADWRRRSYPATLGIALLAALPWLLIWPAALYARSPHLFYEWFWLNNFGRYFGFAHLGAVNSVSWFYTRTLLWFAFPAWPFALWTLWRRGRAGLDERGVQLTVLGVVLLAVVLGSAEVARDQYALPLLIPIALLGTPAFKRLPDWLARPLGWGGALLWGGVAAGLWGVWVVMSLRGAPPHVALLARYLPMNYVPRPAALPFAAAVILTLGWGYGLWALRRRDFRPVATWVLGMTLTWGLLGTLWLPWVNAAKSYRGMIGSLQGALPVRYRCIAGRGVDESQRAMLDYMAHIITVPAGEAMRTPCSLLLVEVRGHDRPTPPASAWEQVWAGSRPGDRYEHDYLYRRTGAPRNRKMSMVKATSGNAAKPVD